MDNVNKIKSDPRLRKFDEKTTFWELLRYKYFTFYFFKRACWAIFRLVLLIGISYLVLFPYISKIGGSFMSRGGLCRCYGQADSEISYVGYL